MYLAVREGRLAEWWRLRMQIHDADSASGLPADLAGAALSTSVAAEVRGPGPRAAEVMDAALRQRPLKSLPDVERPYFAIAIAYARAGEPDRARSVLAEYTAAVTDTALRRFWAPSFHEASGEILLASHRAAEAIPEFRQGFTLPDGPRDVDTITLPLDLGRAFDAAGKPDSAIVQYERYLSTPGFFYRMGLERDAVWLPIVHQRLGDLYATIGNAAKAADQFRAFIELWKNADPELQPRVAEARRRLASLTVESGAVRP